MAVMEFLKANKLNTTTMLVVPANNTGTAAFLFDRNRSLGFTSVGYDSNTACVISIAFPTPTVLSHVLLQKHNLSQFRIYYNSVTANSLAIVTGNSQSSTYIAFPSQTVNSIDIQMDTAMTAGQDKSIGELIVTERRLQFDFNPNADNYEPKKPRKRIRHDMPDGGVKMLQVADKFKARISWKYITPSFTSSLEGVYDDGSENYFVPFPTTTAWDGKAYEVLWTSDWDFKPTTNAKDQYGGSMVLEETPSA